MSALVEKYHLGSLKAGDKKSSSGFCLHNGKDLFVYYVPKENINIGVRLPKKLKGGEMTGTWFDPLTGTFSEPIQKEISQWPSFDKPMDGQFGILIVEIGVGIAVMSVMVWLYYNISSSGRHDEGL